jgi:hypothetical protein
MSYQRERDEFIGAMSREGLPVYKARQLLALATTINRLAELACSSEAADRDRIPCPAERNRCSCAPGDAPMNTRVTSRAHCRRHGEDIGPHPCLCDAGDSGEHFTIPRIRLQDYRAEQRAIALMPAGWRVVTEGDPRGYTLRVIPPSYAARNEGRDRHNLEAIGVPPRDSGIRW